MTDVPAAAAAPALPSYPDETGLERLQRAPIVDRIDDRTLKLIKSTIAPGCTDAEVGHFLELCAHYDLDPFAREAWCAKGKNGKLLIMVGRDGLRKIAQRNGLHVDGDVVRANDDLTVTRTPDGNRTIAHSYGSPADRGAIVGAWAECREGGPLGRPMGYFYAPLDEYLPSGASEYSPWKKQVGVMVLAAAERQAIRQATPMGGLLAEGEDEVVRDNGIAAGAGSGEAPGVELSPEVEAIIARAADLSHAQLADRATAEMTLGSQPPVVWVQWVAKATADLDAMEAPMSDAQVVNGDEAPAVCGVRDAERPGVTCTMRAGHDGMHGADGEAWQAFLEDDGPVVKDEPSGDAPVAGMLADCRDETSLAQALRYEKDADPAVDDAFGRLVRQRDALAKQIDEADMTADLGDASAELDMLEEAIAKVCPHEAYALYEENGPPRCNRCGTPLPDGDDTGDLPL